MLIKDIALFISCIPNYTHALPDSCSCYLRSVEQLQGVRQEVLDAIDATLDLCLTETSVDGFGDVTVVRTRDHIPCGDCSSGM